MNKQTLSSAAIIAGLAIAPALLTSSAEALSFVKTQAIGEQSTSSLIGLRVENAAGDKLGDINYLVLDNAGKVSTAVIGVGGFLGVGEKNVGVPFNEIKFSEKDGNPVALIDASKDNLSSAPNYVWTEGSAMKKSALDSAKQASEAPAPNSTPFQTQ